MVTMESRVTVCVALFLIVARVALAGSTLQGSSNSDVTATLPLTSPNGLYQLAFYSNQAAGLDLRSSDPFLFTTLAQIASADTSLVLQADCNLVLRTPDNVVWSTGTTSPGNAPCKLVMQDDRRLVLYSRTNQIVWEATTIEGKSTAVPLCTNQRCINCQFSSGINSFIWFVDDVSLSRVNLALPVPVYQSLFLQPTRSLCPYVTSELQLQCLRSNAALKQFGSGTLSLAFICMAIRNQQQLTCIQTISSKWFSCTAGNSTESLSVADKVLELMLTVCTNSNTNLQLKCITDLGSTEFCTVWRNIDPLRCLSASSDRDLPVIWGRPPDPCNGNSVCTSCRSNAGITGLVPSTAEVQAAGVTLPSNVVLPAAGSPSTSLCPYATSQLRVQCLAAPWSANEYMCLAINNQEQLNCLTQAASTLSGCPTVLTAIQALCTKVNSGLQSRCLSLAPGGCTIWQTPGVVPSKCLSANTDAAVTGVWYSPPPPSPPPPPPPPPVA